MRAFWLALSLVMLIAGSQSQAAGLRRIEIAAGPDGPAMAAAIWSPCALAPQEIDMGDSRTFSGVLDCPLVGSRLPLIVISHGRTGWYGGHHDTAAALADAGFVVAAISHPRDNGRDNSGTDSLSVMAGRSGDIKRLVDFMLAVWPDRSHIDRARIGLYGFSMGGSTALVVIGGSPDFRKGHLRCEGAKLRMCVQLENGELPGDPIMHDPRVKAAVIVDPWPAFLFPADRLSAVTIPVQLWSSDPALEADGLSGCCAAGIRERLPSKPEWHFVQNAKHFSFLAICSPKEALGYPRICTDAPGFDRTTFHSQLHADMIAFFHKHLGNGRDR